MNTATIDDVMTHLPELLDRVATGERFEIVRNGTVVGSLGPPATPRGVPVIGRAKGMLIVHSEDDDHLEDFEEYMP